MSSRQSTTLLAALLVPLLFSGCAAAVGAAAGVGAVRYVSGQTATTSLDVTVQEAADVTQAVFQEMSIELDREERESTKVEFDGSAPNGLSVDVDIEVDADLTKIDVSASEDLVRFDEDYARQILERIVERAS